jgi:hypothetical protein
MRWRIVVLTPAIATLGDIVFKGGILPIEVFGMKNNQVEYAEDLLDEFVHLGIWAALYSFVSTVYIPKRSLLYKCGFVHDVRMLAMRRPDNPENFNLVNKLL